MKKLFLMFGVMALAVTAFTGCKDKDKDDENFGKAAAGTYKGTLNVSILPETPLPDQSLVVTRKSNTTADISADIDVEGVIKIKVTAPAAILSGKLENIAIAFNDKLNISESLPGEGNDKIATTITGKIVTQNKMDLTITLKDVTVPDGEGGTKKTDIVVTTTGATKQLAE